MNAIDFLQAAAGHMADRAETYDKPEGERSMERAVAAFNVLANRNLSTEDGWLFMAVLKIVRHRARPEGHQDSLEDLVAYTSLMAEEALR